MNLSARALLTFAIATTFAAGCRHMPSEKEKTLSVIQYDLAVQAMHEGKLQVAYSELEKSLALDPYNSRAHGLMGILLHNGFKRPQEAIPHYERAIELDPQFSEARVNLGNVYLDLGRYDEAANLYEQALNDMRYETPYLAHTNLGMAEYRRGNVDKAVENLRSAITLNPKFCIAHRNLGTIYDETGKLEDACRQFGKYREACPEVAEAYYREGMCLARQGDAELAQQRFVECEAKAPEGQLKDDCRRLGGQLQ